MAEMPRSEVKHYLDRLTLFRNTKQLCRELGVTYPTMIRWLDGETKPSVAYRIKFEKAFDLLLDELDTKGDVGKDIADVLAKVAPPTPRDAVILKPTKLKRKVLADELVKLLEGGKPHRSKKIIEACAKLGFSRAAVQITAQHLGVEKEHIGAGRNSYSLWRLR